MSCSAVRALFGKDVLIPFHLLSMAVSCSQAFGRQASEIGATVQPHPHPPAPPPPACAHPSSSQSCSLLLAGQPPSNGISGLTPCQLPHLPFYFGCTAGQGWEASAKPLAARRAAIGGWTSWTPQGRN